MYHIFYNVVHMVQTGPTNHVQAVAGPSKSRTEQESVQRGNDEPPVNVPAAPSEEGIVL